MTTARKLENRHGQSDHVELWRIGYCGWELLLRFATRLNLGAVEGYNPSLLYLRKHAPLSSRWQNTASDPAHARLQNTASKPAQVQLQNTASDPAHVQLPIPSGRLPDHSMQDKLSGDELCGYAEKFIVGAADSAVGFVFKSRGGGELVALNMSQGSDEFVVLCRLGGHKLILEQLGLILDAASTKRDEVALVAKVVGSLCPDLQIFAAQLKTRPASRSR